MTSIAVFDPGVTTGIVTAICTARRLSITGKYEVPGGLDGLVDDFGLDYLVEEHSIAVCEKFRMTPRVRKAEQVEPLRIEGAVKLAFGKTLVWQYPDSMLLAGGNNGSPSRNKTAADNVLRSMGLWTLPSEVDGHPDANDVNSAMKHLVAYLRNHNHEPTLEALGVR